MTAYWFFVFSSLLLALNKNKIILFLLFIFFTTFRVEVGGDWFKYNIAYHNHSTFEPLYTFLQNSLSYFDNFQFLVFTISAIVISLFFSAINKYSNFFALSIIVWLSTNYLSFGLLRQSISVALFFYSIQFIYSNDKTKYFIFSILALGFHYSAIILFPLYYFLKNNYSKRNILTILIIAAIGLKLDIFNTIIDTFINFLSFNNVAKYLIDERLSVEMGFGVRFFEALGIFTIALLYKNYLEIKFKYFYLFFNLLFGYLLVYIVLNNTMVFVVRFIKYFEISYIILIPYLSVLIKNRIQKNLTFLVIVLYFYLRFYITIQGLV